MSCGTIEDRQGVILKIIPTIFTMPLLPYLIRCNSKHAGRQHTFEHADFLDICGLAYWTMWLISGWWGGLVYRFFSTFEV